MPSTRRALTSLGLGIGLIALGVTLIRIATLTQNWLLVFLALPPLFIGLVQAAEGMPKRTSHKTIIPEA